MQVISEDTVTALLVVSVEFPQHLDEMSFFDLSSRHRLL